MEKFVITGGKPLHGEVTISGAKNAAVGILPATILAADVCVIENLPDISDVSVSLKILSTLGAQVKMLNRNTYEIDTRHLVTTNVPDDLSRQMRASYYFLGALLSRFGKAQVAMPGGCNLGPRPIDQHLKVFSALGAEDSVDYGMITVRTKQELTGAHIFFDKVSVGATMNGMLSAVMAKGQTILENCAKEPHVVDLANFLNMCGADVRGAGTDVIKVRGVEKCTVALTASSRIRSRPAAIWWLRLPPAAMSSSRTSPPSIWSPSRQSCAVQGSLWKNLMMLCGYPVPAIFCR